MPWLALYNGGYVGGSLDPSQLGTQATLCLTLRAVQLNTPRAQPLVYIGDYTNSEGFGFGLDENFNVSVWQARAGMTSSRLVVTPGVTNFICVAYVFDVGGTQAQVSVYQPNLESQLITIGLQKVSPSAQISVGGWAGNTFTGFVNNVQVRF